ncbi:hypothetical protein FKM82_027417 [Ascaphus truei]
MSSSFSRAAASTSGTCNILPVYTCTIQSNTLCACTVQSNNVSTIQSNTLHPCTIQSKKTICFMQSNALHGSERVTGLSPRYCQRRRRQTRPCTVREQKWTPYISLLLLQ